MFDDEKINFILGNSNLDKNPNLIFDNLIIDFLNSISIEIMKKKKLKIYSDLYSYGFWCRKNNLLKIKKTYDLSRIGRGIAFHICPSNVPMNFAFSMSLGLLAGNSNIIRLPSSNFPQVSELCKIIKNVLKKKKFNSIKKKLCLINYSRSDEISEKISKNVDLRIIWGGDETVQKFKQYITKPRCIDLNFSNRYSFSIINSKKFNQLKLDQIQNLAQRFYSDTYTMDQNGCSSPKAIFWVGKILKNKKELFWKEIIKLADNFFNLNLSRTSIKFYNLNKDILSQNKKLLHSFENFKVVRIKFKSFKELRSLEDIQPGFGVFAETNISKIKLLNDLLTSKSQTMTYFGYENQQIKKIILKNKFKGIDRVVQIGNAFNMSHIWDGLNIIDNLSREISLQ